MNSLRNNLWILFALALACYLLPWLVNPGVSLTLGGYDLAEWISLRLPDRPMDTVQLIRLPPVLIAIMFALLYPRFSRGWWFAAISVLVIAFALLPPFEFFLDANQRGDVNYSQQFSLALATLIGGLIALSGIFYRFHAYLIAALSLATAAVVLISLRESQAIMHNLGLPGEIGVGVIALLLVLGVIIVLQILEKLKPPRSEGA